MRKFVPLKRLTLDVMAQPRVRTKDAIAEEYAARMKAGDKFPPAVAFSDGKTIWLADGWHRLAAAAGNGAKSLLCDVRKGDLRAAILYAVGANDTHGMKRTNADKRKAVLILLRDEKWCKWSDREIARRCRVADTFVGDLRSQLRLTADTHRKFERGGKIHEMVIPAGAAEFKEEFQRTAPVSRAILDIVEATERLPPADDAARLFRWIDQHPPEKFETVSAWFSAFAAKLREIVHGQEAA